MRILIADDDREMCELLSEYVRACGHEVVETVSAGGLAAMRSFARHHPDLVMLDLKMPQYGGWTAGQQMLSRDPSAKVIFVSGQVDAIEGRLAGCPGAFCLRKPFTFEQARLVLERCAGCHPPAS